MQDRSKIANLPNGHARAFWVYLCANEAFRRAEEVRYTDDHRRGQKWDGYLSEADLQIKRDETAVHAFETSVRERFGSPNVHVDLFDRHRQRHGKTDVTLVQATVYVEGRPDQALEFIDGQLDLRDHRPVVEASLTYEPTSGSIEVVDGDDKTRENLLSTSCGGRSLSPLTLPTRSRKSGSIVCDLLAQHRERADYRRVHAANRLTAFTLMSREVVASQKAEGWTLVPDYYDDGGFSGGTLERPALKRLIADVEADRVDIIVVYKIDRLSRSLMDFAKLVEVFDRRNVTFVSVTQAFNTTTSMGRLTLNILLSFAQFEREVIGERIRTSSRRPARRACGSGAGRRSAIASKIASC